MIVSCEKCNKRYRIKPQKLKEAKSSLKCIQCGHIVHIQKSYKEEGKIVSAAEAGSINSESWSSIPDNNPGTAADSPPRSDAVKSIPWKHHSDLLFRRFSGLWGKMIMLFFLIPITILIGSSLFSIFHLKNLTKLISKESTILSTWLVEDKTAEICRAVASQVSLYLKSHPKLHSKQLMQNPVFKRIAIQKAGTTGYTSLYQMSDPRGALYVWAHKDPAYVGMDLKQIHRASLTAVSEKNYNQFVDILMGVKGLKVSRGSYAIADSNGKVHKEIMVCTPIEGTPYVISVATPMDDLPLPVKQFERRVNAQNSTARHMIVFAVVITMAAIGTAVLVFGSRLTWNIVQLTHAADRISSGDLSAKVETERNDELGDLAHAIFRIRENQRLSLKQVR